MSEALPHTEALLELFEQTDRPVGDGEAPKPVAELQDSDYPYSVLYDHETIWWKMQGPINNTQADKQFTFMVVYVGLTRRQVQMLAERGRTLVAAENVIVPDHKTRDFRFESLGRVLRDDDIRPGVFVISDMYLLDVTPTTG